jgi:hypothetical protein
MKEKKRVFKIFFENIGDIMAEMCKVATLLPARRLA